jgi:hypothetical protein
MELPILFGFDGSQ